MSRHKDYLWGFVYRGAFYYEFRLGFGWILFVRDSTADIRPNRRIVLDRYA